MKTKAGRSWRPPLSFHARSVLRGVNDDRAAADRGAFRQRAVGTRTELVVVNDDVLLQVLVVAPDLDPEAIGSAATGDLPVDRGQQELVALRVVEAARALELRACAAHHEPVIRVAVELEVRGLEAEIRRTG